MIFLSVGLFNTKEQHNQSLKLNAYHHDFKPYYANDGFGKLSYIACPASA
jgi:hypothetical protein